MKVFVIGTGNVATALGMAIQKAGHTITGVYGRSIVDAQKLASKLNSNSFSLISKIPQGSDIYLIAINDDAIAEVIKSMKHLNGIIAHTSGTTPLSSLEKFNNKGVFYPVQTIKKNNPKSFKKVPICLEASNEHSMKLLLELANSISSKIYILDSDQRAILHLAAVFTNNFTNHLLNISVKILENNHLPSSLIEPLALSTIQNAFTKGPYYSQTGPAVRNDKVTISKQLKMLKKIKGQHDIYKLLTNEIINVHKNSKKK